MTTAETVDVIRQSLSLIQFNPGRVEQVYVPLESNDVVIREVILLSQ
jgi:hypothetical protein